MIAKLFGVKLPSTTHSKLSKSLIEIEKGSKKTLYFLYSEFLLRANRNPWYKEVLNRSDFSAIDGKGLLWSQMKLNRLSLIPNVYKALYTQLPFLIRVPFFLVLFLVQLLVNLLLGFFLIVAKFDIQKLVKNELILGRKFIYNLFDFADTNKWTVLIIAAGNENKQKEIKTKILKLHPKLKLDFWTKPSDSQLMKDEFGESFKVKMVKDGITLNTNNLFEAFPELLEAKEVVKKKKYDLVLVCLGGASGKQEFFIDNLKQDDTVKFTLSTGVGAAIDHLGAGVEQKKPPKWLTDAGLEWLFRFINQPYRRGRIWDSIFTLWWWTTLQEFQIFGESRKTAVNVIKKYTDEGEEEFLLLRRREILPGDLGWTFIQGGIEKNENPEIGGLREINEEVKFKNSSLNFLQDAKFVNIEDYPVSLLRYILLGAKYNSSKNYLNVLEFTGNELPVVNFENFEARWFKQNEVENYLSVEKLPLWKKYLEFYTNQI